MDSPEYDDTPLPLPPMVLYRRLMAGSASLACQIQRLDGQDPALVSPLEAAWVSLDDLIKQLPEALACEAARATRETEHAQRHHTWKTVVFTAAWTAFTVLAVLGYIPLRIGTNGY